MKQKYKVTRKTVYLGTTYHDWGDVIKQQVEYVYAVSEKQAISRVMFRYGDNKYNMLHDIGMDEAEKIQYEAEVVS